MKVILEGILQVQIHTIEVQNIERNTGNINIKRKYLDALLKTNIGKIEIEVNACFRPYVNPRNMAYLCDVYASHTLVGKIYKENTKIIQINFTYGLQNSKKWRIYKMQDETLNVYVKNFIIYEINMEYFKKIWNNRRENKKEVEENIYYIMLDLERKELEEIAKEDKVVKRYMEEIVRLNQNPEFREFMSHEEDLQMIQNSLREEGIEQGKKESCEQIAKNLKKLGIALCDISSATGIPITEIEKM